MNPYAEEIIQSLKTDKNFLSEKFGVVNIGMFGSCAAGNQNKDSDIDILVELKAPRFDWMAGLQIYLEKKFDRKVDLIRKSTRLKSGFIKRIEKEVFYA
ncbi:Nucleotidyltransferase domain-containing protein [Desulfonema limicola]|uniref:Nucleotidyltransferase domain-containing protein n=1 Tax=Desulfonema limicola TaxID=45656 RepID=A0A975B5J3_9BACT|nr:nucleotidyltransferase domain-containing protein [Desulfonema limicola]QTA79201.1 Nucleotidyltransferase domain-containing protein [Desulfonema limicola]